jgi:putative oxidoreductase
MPAPASQFGAFGVRATIGTAALAHGLLKIFVFTLPGTVGFFESLGLPGFLAYFTILAEIAGGAALLLGFYPKLAALALLPVMAGATWAHAGNGWVFSNQGGGWEFPLMLTVLTLLIVVQGGGRFQVPTIPALNRLIPAFLR